MSRSRKLLIVSLVLALGICLALPFRHAAPQFAPTAPDQTPVMPLTEAVTTQSTPGPAVRRAASTPPLAERQVAAKMTSTVDGVAASSARGFDVENRPALIHQSHAEPPPSSAYSPDPTTTTREARPAYATAPTTPTEDAAWPEEVLHVVRNGDTLEKLAQHYLGDKGRALEIFDLNRDQLTNPHLLPIGAELRIPVPPERDID